MVDFQGAKLSLGHVVQLWVKAFRQSLLLLVQKSSQPKVPNPTPAVLAKSSADVKESSPPPKKIVDINQPQTCKNNGCGKVFKEIENHESACSYHPGPAVFHDRVRGWKCCDIYVKEFDEFMTIPPCKKGWHNADPVP
ncbi:cysteine and histidine-rich domain-containing protein RAR1 isoform X1 [Gossypium australe]|uniref:Cysteine and histidine-rich domain-containing protein RAR1 isoform X1 n=1 Tax=Gossypium australe TaxID=47621 RepID=A0A5B6UFZ0_9ROSI|nr:cysteine and histidine-rich domain-containing protein RAR1 isoform X1 [Gossypium australe]